MASHKTVASLFLLCMTAGSHTALADGITDANSGLAALRQAEFQKAVASFTRALRKGLSHADRESAFIERARAFLGAGNNQAALADLLEAEKLDPTDKDVGILRAQAQGIADGPSLADAMAIVEQAIGEEGPIKFTLHISDSATGKSWTTTHEDEASEIHADPSSCRINYHWKKVVDNNISEDLDLWFNLNDVSSLDVLSEAQNTNQVDVREGHPTWGTEIDPPHTVLNVLRRVGNNEFLFRDSDKAIKVAETLWRAVQLCGGGRPPF